LYVYGCNQHKPTQMKTQSLSSRELLPVFSGFVKKLGLAVLTVSMFMNINIAKAQNSNDFWAAFEKCTQLTELQMQYSTTPPLIHYVMDHGVDIPPTNGFMFDLNTQYVVESKEAINTNQRNSFFLLHEVKFDLNQAIFDFVYHYNYTGNLDTYKAVVVHLEKQNGIWTVVSSTVSVN
jgi:hypothetical protein